MRAGRLRHYGVIQNQDNSGNVPDGARTWSTYATAWAGVEPVRGYNEVDQGTKKTQADTTHILTFRYIRGITPAMRFLLEGRIFIFRVILNTDERDRTLEIEAREETDG